MNNARLDKSRFPNDFVGNNAYSNAGNNFQWIQLYKFVKIWIMGIYPSENVLVHYQRCRKRNLSIVLQSPISKVSDNNSVNWTGSRKKGEDT